MRSPRSCWPREIRITRACRGTMHAACMRSWTRDDAPPSAPPAPVAADGANLALVAVPDDRAADVERRGLADAPLLARGAGSAESAGTVGLAPARRGGVRLALPRRNAVARTHAARLAAAAQPKRRAARGRDVRLAGHHGLRPVLLRRRRAAPMDRLAPLACRGLAAGCDRLAHPPRPRGRPRTGTGRAGPIIPAFSLPSAMRTLAVCYKMSSNAAQEKWRRGPESNRPRRICNPLHNRFVTAPDPAKGARKKGSSGLPFSCIWSGRRVSNSRPQPWQGCALPTELLPHSKPGIIAKFRRAKTTNGTRSGSVRDRPRGRPHRGRHLDAGRRRIGRNRRLFFEQCRRHAHQRELQHLVDPLDGHDLKPGLHVLRDLLQILLVLLRNRSEGTRLNSSHHSMSYAVFCLKK